MNYPVQQYPQPQYPQPPAPAPQQQFPGYPAPAPQYPQAPAYPQQGYPAPAPQPPAQPLAQGTLDAYYSQPSVGGGPSLSWTDKQSNQPKPIGTSYAGIVARDVTNADIQQQTDFRTQAPLFYKDGRPKFAMKVPLKVQPSPEFPEGECSWFVKGQARDELVRAMAEAGCEGAPKAGALIVVTLVQRRPSGAGMNPANIVQVRYQPPQGAGAPSPAPTPQQAPAPQPQAQQQPATLAGQPNPFAQPGAQGVDPFPQQQQYANGGFVQPQAPAPQQPAQGQTVTVDQALAQAQAPQQPQGQPTPQPPSDLSPEQQALLAQLTGGGQ